MTGNGIWCEDINECAINNGGCSIVPKVQCRNMMPGFSCDGCPAGYEGDGRYCKKVLLISWLQKNGNKSVNFCLLRKKHFSHKMKRCDCVGWESIFNINDLIIMYWFYFNYFRLQFAMSKTGGVLHWLLVLNLVQPLVASVSLDILETVLVKKVVNQMEELR